MQRTSSSLLHSFLANFNLGGTKAVWSSLKSRLCIDKNVINVHCKYSTLSIFFQSDYHVNMCAYELSFWNGKNVLSYNLWCVSTYGRRVAPTILTMLSIRHSLLSLSWFSGRLLMRVESALNLMTLT